MALNITAYDLGPLSNNTYLLVDTITSQAVIVDPSFDSHIIAEKIIADKLHLVQIWLTHAHFDHIAGAKLFSEFSQPPLPIGLHPDDLDLYHQGGGAGEFGIKMPTMPEPTLFFRDKQVLRVGEEPVEVRHTPGHSPGGRYDILRRRRAYRPARRQQYTSAQIHFYPGAEFATPNPLIDRPW